MNRAAASLVLLVALALATPAAQAFASLPPGTSPHDDITAEGARRAGFPEEAAKALQQAVREPDMQDSEYDPELDEPGRIDADDEYHPGHHCDRVAPSTDADAFNATVAYIAAQRSRASNSSAAGEAGQAVTHLGRALHAVQDCYSHSNIVDLGPDAQEAFGQALLEAGPPVAGLRLVAYEPGADDPGRPEGDDYAHDDFAKDSADGNEEAKAELPDGRTKFQAARDLATDATAAFLDGFLQELPEGQRLELMEATPEDGGLPDDVPVPGPTLVPALAVAAGAALLARRRRLVP